MLLVEEVPNAWSASDAEWSDAGKAAQVLTGAQVGNGSWRFGPWVLYAGSVMTVNGTLYSRELQIEVAALDAIAMGGLDGANAGRGGTQTTPLNAVTLGLRAATSTAYVFGEARIVRISDDCYRVDLGTASSTSGPLPVLQPGQTAPPPASTPTLSVLLKRTRTSEAYEYSLQVREMVVQAHTRVALSRWFAPFAEESHAEDAVAYHLTTRTQTAGYVRNDIVPLSSTEGYGAVLGLSLVWRVPYAHAVCSGRGSSTASAAALLAMTLLLLFALLVALAAAARSMYKQRAPAPPAIKLLPA